LSLTIIQPRLFTFYGFLYRDLGTSFLFGTATVLAFPANCLLEIDGKKYIDGICEFTPGSGGDFQISGKNHYFAQLGIYDRGDDSSLASLNWNANPRSIKAHAFVGDVRRNGACWENKRSKICARKLHPDEQQKIENARPNGEKIVLEVPGYPGVCLSENLFSLGTEVVLGDCVGVYGEYPKLFKRTIDNIVFDKHPGICIDTQSTNKKNVSILVLEDCQKATTKWHYFKGTIHSSTKDLCWSLPDPDNTNDLWPINILATPCRANLDENVRFQFSKGG